MVDTHAHIYSPKFDADRAAVLERAFGVGVKRIYMPNVDNTTIEPMLEVELRYPDICLPMIGLHPCEIRNGFEKELYQIEDWLMKHKFYGIGETGIDLYWDKTYYEHQKEAFRIQAQWAKAHKLPLVVHTRHSMDETLELIEGLQDGRLFGVIHCFSGTSEQAQKAISLGFMLGIGGVVTYKNGGLEVVLPQIGLESVVLETDCPYLAPVPFRGQRNEPAYVLEVAKKIAELLNQSPQHIIQITTENASRLFHGSH